MRGRRPVAIFVVVAMSAVACTGDDDGTTTAPNTETTTAPPRPAPTTPDGVAPPPPPPAIAAAAHALVPPSGSVVGLPIAIAADVFSAEPISALALSVDGVVSERVEFPTPDEAAKFVFVWMPTGAGLHVAEVFATAASGVTVGSPPTWLSVAPGDVDEPAGSTLDIAGAGVTIDPEACTASIEVPAVPDAGGLIVKGATPGTPRFAALDILAATGGTVSVPMTTGPILVRADTYTTEAVTETTAFLVPGLADCGGGWTGDLQIVDGVLVGDLVDATDMIYLYASPDGSRWSRLPAAPSTFVQRSPRGFDLTESLDDVVEPGGDLTIEGWGWQGDNLVDLGTGSYEHREVAESPWNGTPLTLPSELTIQQTRFDPNTAGNVINELDHATLCLGSVAAGGCVDAPSLFHWRRFAGSEAGLLQMSRLPFPSGSSVAPAGLVYAEMIPTDDATELFIPLDLEDLAGLGDRPMENAKFTYGQLDAMQADLSIIPDTPPTGPRRTDEFFRGDTLTSLLATGDRLYVRIVHFVDGRPTDAGSNSVQIAVDRSHLVITPQPLGSAALQLEVDIDLPRTGNPAFEHCVRVIENPFGSDNPVPTADQFLKSPFYLVAKTDARTHTAAGVSAGGLERGATACARAPTPPDKNFIDYIADVVGVIGAAWDLYVEVWNMLKQKLVQGVVFVTGCTPEEVCTAVAAGMLDVGLAILGVPPTMPKFADLVDISKGEMAEVAARAIVTDSGLCPNGITTQCEEIVAEALAWVLDEIQDQVSDSAIADARDGKYELWINPDVAVVSEPAGKVSFGFADVAVTRPATTAGTTYTTCAVTFEVFATGRALWTEANGTYHDEVVTERVIGPVTTLFDPNLIAPGETKQVALLPVDFDRTTHLNGANGYGYKSQYDAMEAWRHLMRQPDTTLRAEVDVCGTSFTATGSRNVPLPTPDLFPTPDPFAES